LEAVERYVVRWFRERYVPPSGVDIRMYSRGSVYTPLGTGMVSDPWARWGEADMKLAFISRSSASSVVVHSRDNDMIPILSSAGCVNTYLVLSSGTVYRMSDFISYFESVYGSASSSILAVSLSSTDWTTGIVKGFGPSRIHAALSGVFSSSGHFCVHDDGKWNSEGVERLLPIIDAARSRVKPGEASAGGGVGHGKRRGSGLGIGVRRTVAYWTAVKRSEGPEGSS